MKEPTATSAPKNPGSRKPRREATVTQFSEAAGGDRPFPSNAAFKDVAARHRKQRRPIILAISTSLIWIAAAIYIGSSHLLDWAETGLTLQDMAILIAGLMSPLIAIWLITLIFMRSSPLRDQHWALVQGLEGLLDPVAIAERRIGQALDKMQERLDEVSAAGEAAGQKLNQLEGRFSGQLLALNEVTASTENRAVTISQSLAHERQALQLLDHEMAHRSAEIHRLVENLSESLRLAASDARAQMRDAEETMIKNAEQLAGANLEELALKLDACATRLQEASGHAGQTRAQVQEIHEFMESGRAGFEIQATAINEATEAAQSRIEHMNALMAEIVKTVKNASHTATTAAETANQSLGAQSEKLLAAGQAIEKSADGLVAHNSRFENILAAQTAGDFNKIAAFLIESLASQAIDIHRVLEIDIPDTVWQKYLKGDRSIFARRTLRLANGKTKDLIARKFREDGEFRDHSQRFIKEFEKLIAVATTTDAQGPLSITLISSELGRLYVLLAQSLKRLP